MMNVVIIGVCNVYVTVTVETEAGTRVCLLLYTLV